MPRPEFIRLALSLADLWAGSQQRRRDQVPSLRRELSPHFMKLRRAEHRRELARRKGLSLIEPLLEEEVLTQARVLRVVLHDAQDCHFPARRELSARHFYGEFCQLEEEFPEVWVDEKQSLLVGITEPVTLRGIHLGPFRLVLPYRLWAQDPDGVVLSVEADDPHPPTMNEQVTHPHVRDGELCAGDAERSLPRALREGRLADAFVLAHSVLTHYNPSSAFVRLEEWGGAPCFDCGIVTSDEDRSSCSCCGEELCGECISNCYDCSESRCTSCMRRCEGCEDYFCGGCLEKCSLTEKEFCASCREVCTTCDRVFAKDKVVDDLCPDCTGNLDSEETPLEVASQRPD